MEDQFMREMREQMAEQNRKKMEPYWKFVGKVKEMRAAQKAYFEARRKGNPGTSQALERSKLLEREVDQMLNFLPQRVEAEQRSLF